jgi:hypothetical protein
MHSILENVIFKTLAIVCLCVKMNLEIKEKNVALKGHSPPQDENVK